MRSEARAMMQGALVGSVLTMQASQFPLRVMAVEQNADDEGTYLPYFDVVFYSGAHVRITVTDLTDDGAQPAYADDVVAIESRARDYRTRISTDMRATMIQFGVPVERLEFTVMLAALADDAMHVVEHLLTEER